MSRDAPREIVDLIERFDRNLEAYRSQGYNETRSARSLSTPALRRSAGTLPTRPAMPRRTRASCMRARLKLVARPRRRIIYSASVARASFSLKPKSPPLTAIRISAHLLKMLAETTSSGTRVSHAMKQNRIKPKISTKVPVALGTVARENLPLPVVHYPQLYGAFFAFSDKQVSSVFLCGCSEPAVRNYLRLKANISEHIKYGGTERTTPLERFGVIEGWRKVISR